MKDIDNSIGGIVDEEGFMYVPKNVTVQLTENPILPEYGTKIDVKNFQPKDTEFCVYGRNVHGDKFLTFDEAITFEEE